MFDRNQSLDLRKLTERLRITSGIYIDKLERGDLLQIKTEKRFYLFKVTDPAERKIALVSSNNSKWRFSEPLVSGSSLDNKGGMVRYGWVTVGFRFSVGKHLMPKIASIKVNNIEMALPPLYKLN